MTFSPTRIIKALYRRLVLDPKGMGRPTDPKVFDAEYRTGSWDHFFSWNELPRNLLLAGAVNHFYPKDAAILDIACGSGRLAQLCQNYPLSRYLGADISEAGIALAQKLKLNQAEFIVANAETWLPREKFDAIIFNECIGYFSDPGAVIKRFIPYLKPNGRFFVSVHRFSRSDAQWKRIEAYITPEATTSVTSDQGNTWDIKVLQPLESVT